MLNTDVSAVVQADDISNELLFAGFLAMFGQFLQVFACFFGQCLGVQSGLF